LGETGVHISCEENHVGIDAVEKDVLLILDIISITQVGELQTAI